MAKINGMHACRGQRPDCSLACSCKASNQILNIFLREYWSEFMSGFNPTQPEVPFAYKKFVNQLQAAGINPIANGTKTHLTAMTDKDVDKLSGDRELKNAETVDWKTMEPVPGGLFDQGASGGHGMSSGGGNRWMHIKLAQPLPNPAFVEPIRRVLGLTKPKFESILSGKEELNGNTSPAAIHDALKSIKLEESIARARMDIASGKRTLRDNAVKRLGYLKSAEKLGLHPSDWMVTKVPVLPPIFRPVSVMGGNKIPLVDDANVLYRDLFHANQNVKDLSQHLDPKDLGEETMATYNAFKAVVGLGDPIQAKNKERNVKGILKHVFGSSPKTGTVQRKLLGSTVDFVSRGVVVPQPDFDMDQVGVPETAAWKMARPMVIRRLVRQGLPRIEAAKAVSEKSPIARKALQEEFDSGVAVMNRAPSWHRYNTMAFKPVIVKGNAIQTSPLIVGGMAMDYDGLHRY